MAFRSLDSLGRVSSRTLDGGVTVAKKKVAKKKVAKKADKKSAKKKTAKKK